MHMPAPIRRLLLLATAACSRLEPPSLWSVPWSWEPSIVVPLLLSCVRLCGQELVRRGSWHTLRWRHASFSCGLAHVLRLRLTSPIHELGEQLFSAHMLQHEILILVSAPLISAAHPAATCLWAFAPTPACIRGRLDSRVSSQRGWSGSLRVP